MRSFFFALLCCCCGLATAAARSEKANTVVLHPGDVVYARFERKGRALKLLSISKDKDDQAQIILHLEKWDRPNRLTNFEIENRFDRELTYQVEARILSTNFHRMPPVSPVVEEKVSFESWPVPVEEVAVFGFILGH